MNESLEENKRILPVQCISAVLNAANSFAGAIVRWNINPNFLTLCALLAGMGAGAFFWQGKPGWAIAAVVLCGLFDVLDGKVATRSNRTSLFGAIFDSTMDRYSEFFIYLGIALYLEEHWVVWLIFFTFLGSTMVSYTRARAEGLGIECRIGIMQRAERMVIVVLATLVGMIFDVFVPAMVVGMAVIAVVSHFTALQRIFHVRKHEKLRKAATANPD